MSDGFDVPINTDDAAKALATLLKRLESFGDKADKVVDQFGKDTSKAFGSAKESANGLEKKLGSIGNTLKAFGVVAIGALGLKAIQGLTGAFEGAIEAAGEKEQALKGVENALRRTGQMSSEALADVSDFADRLEDTTGIADDTALKMFTLASSFTTSKDQAKKLVTAANDLSAATGKSLEASVTALGKSLSGTLGPLDDFDPSLKRLSKSALEAGGAIDAVMEQFGGAAAAQMDTFAGASSRVKNAFDDLNVAFGKMITENGPVRELLNGLASAIQIVEKSIGSNSGGFKEFIADIAIGVTKQIPPMLLGIDAMTRGFKTLTGDTTVTDFFDNLAIAIGAISDSILDLNIGLLELKQSMKDTSFRKPDSAAQQGAVDDLSKIPGFDIEKIRAGSEAILQKLADQGVIQVDTTAKQLEELKKLRADNVARVGSMVTGTTPAGAPQADTTLLKLADSISESIKKMEAAATEMKDGVKVVADQGNKPQPVAIEGGTVPGFGGFDFGPIMNTLARVAGSLETVGAGFLAGISTGGEAGARKAVGGAAAGIAQLAGAGGPMAGAIGSAIEILGQDPEAFKSMIEGFVEGIPVIIDNIVENIPVLIETLANNLGPIITSLINAIPRITLAIIKAIPVVIQSILTQLAGGLNFQGAKMQESATNFSLNLNKGIDNFIAKLTSGGERIKAVFSNLITNQINFQKGLADKQIEFARKIGEFIKGQITKNIEFAQKIVNAGRDFATKIFEGFQRIKKSIDGLIESITGAFNVGGGGGGSSLPFAKGGVVPMYAAGGAFVPRGTDTVPAMLTPGELVIPRDMVKELTGQGGGDIGEAALALLAQAVALLSQPTQVSTQVMVRDKVFADIMLDLDRRGARVSA